MPVGMEVTEDTPADMLTGSMSLKLVLPTGKKIKTSVERSTPMMDLLVHITTCHKLSPAAHVLQPYGERGVLPYKPSTPIGALDTVMVHVIPKNQLTQNQSNKMALKQVSQPFEQTYRIQVSLPRNQLYVLRANGRTTIEDIQTEICSEKNLDTTKYSLRHPKDLGSELRGDMTITEYKCNHLVLVSNKSNPVNQLSTDDIINAIQNINNNNNNIYAFEPSSRSLSPDSSTSPVPVQEPLKPLRKKKPPAPPPPSNNKKGSKEKSGSKEDRESTAVSSGRVISHSRTSSDSSGYHEASLLSESPPSNNSSLPDSLPRRSKLDAKLKGSKDRFSIAGGVAESTSVNSVQQNQALSKSLVDLKAHHAETSGSSSSVVQHSSLKSAQSTTSLNTGRKKRLAPPPPPSAPPPMKTVIEERLNGSSETNSEILENERSRTLEPDRKPPVDQPAKCSTLPPGLTMSSTLDNEVERPVDVVVEPSHIIPDVELPISPPDERDLVMEDEEIDRIFNNATADHSLSLPRSSPLVEGDDSGRDSTGSNEVSPKTFNTVEANEKLPNVLPSPVRPSPEEPLMDWEYKLPAPPTFRDPPEAFKVTDIPDNIDSGVDTLTRTPRSAIMSELSSVISQRSTSVTKLNEQLPLADEEIENTSTLDNFKITTYTKNNRSSTRINPNVSVRRNNSLVRENGTNSTLSFSDQGANSVKRSVSHVSLFVRPHDNLRSRTLDRVQDNQIISNGLRKTTSEFNIDSVGRKQERPQSFADSQSLQSLQVLKSILPQLSRSQGSLNTISESESPAKPPVEPVTTEKPAPRYEKEERVVAVSLSTWGERPKRQVSIKSDRDYVFGQGVGLNKVSSSDNLHQDGPTSVLPSQVKNTSFFTPQVKGVREKLILEEPAVSTSPVSETVVRKDSVKDSFVSSFPLKESIKVQKEEIKMDSNDDTSQSDDEKKVKRITNVYKSLDTGNTKPLRQILGDVSRIPVVRSVELKAPYRQDWSRNTGLNKLKERFETDPPSKDASPTKETESFESTEKIRERFETAIKERYVATEKMYVRRDHSETNLFKPKETTKINILPLNKSNETPEHHKYESKVKIDGNNTFVLSNNKTEMKIELNKTSGDVKPASNRYTSVVGIGGKDCEVRVKTISRAIPPQSPPDPRQQLLTSIRGFGGLESLRKVRS